MPTEAPTSAELDAADPLARFRAHFAGAVCAEGSVAPGDGVISYLDGNSLGRPVIGVAERLAEFVDDAWGRRLIRAWDEAWLDEPTVLGDRLGEVVLGAAPGQTVVGDSTSVLLYKLIRSAVGADPRRREIVVDRDNFPTDRFILQGIAAECGLTLRWLQPDRAAGVRPADLADVLSDRTALVVLSHVALVSPRDPDRRGSHVTIEHPELREVCAAVWQRGVIPDFRPPNGIRLGLSPLSTTFAEVELGPC